MAHKNYYQAQEETEEEKIDDELENPADENEEDDFERADEFGDGGDGY